MNCIQQALTILVGISLRFPKLIIILCVTSAAAGFFASPYISLCIDPLKGIGHNAPVIQLTTENHRLFGEQDSLIVVLVFPEPPGQAKRTVITTVGQNLQKLNDIRRVRYRFLDPTDEQQMDRMYARFLLGMDRQEANTVQGLFSSPGIAGALRRNRNRLFLTYHPYIQEQILRDPLEMGRVIHQSFRERFGEVSLADIYLFLASPDSTTYLIQMTPDFPSSHVEKSRDLLQRVQTCVANTVEQLKTHHPGTRAPLDGITWRLTGKLAFHAESDQQFEGEVLTILLLSATLVGCFLAYAYGSLPAGFILIIPVILTIGSNYLVMYWVYDEVNPVVMASLGVLFGLGTDFGVHLWGRLHEESERNTTIEKAIVESVRQAGPPVVLGAMTSVIAFLSLRLSAQPAMGQFGAVGATGVSIALLMSLLLVPAMATVICRRRADLVPTLRLRARGLSAAFLYCPRGFAWGFPVIILLSLVGASTLSYEKNLIKAFLSTGIPSLEVADRVSQTFQSNFSQPTLLTFDVPDWEEGIRLQRALDERLRRLMRTDRQIATFDSISYLEAPHNVRSENRQILGAIVASWGEIQRQFMARLDDLGLAPWAQHTVTAAFERLKNLLTAIASGQTIGPGPHANELEKSWYHARIGDTHRFLTRLRYRASVDRPSELKAADAKLRHTLKSLPMNVSISGPRQAMEAVLDSLVSELVRLGGFALIFVTVFLLLITRNVMIALLTLVPMIGAFTVTLGLLGAAGMGVPFSIIGVAPLIFGLGIDNGVHVVHRALAGQDTSVAGTMERLTPLIVVTSITTLFGFLAMVTSHHYAMEFLGWAMVLGMGSALLLTVLVLPAQLWVLRKPDTKHHQAGTVAQRMPGGNAHGRGSSEGKDDERQS